MPEFAEHEIKMLINDGFSKFQHKSPKTVIKPPHITLVNLYVDLQFLPRFRGIYAGLLETKNGGDR